MDEFVRVAVIAGVDGIKVDLDLLGATLLDQRIGEGLVGYPHLQRFDVFIADVGEITLLCCRSDENGTKRYEKDTKSFHFFKLSFRRRKIME